MASPVTWLWTPETDETGAACAGALMSAPQAINAATAYFNISIPFCSHVHFSALFILSVFGRARTDTENTYNAPSRTGFGSTALCRVAKESLDAQIEFDYASAGLIWQLQYLRPVMAALHALTLEGSCGSVRRFCAEDSLPWTRGHGATALFPLIGVVYHLVPVSRTSLRDPSRLFAAQKTWLAIRVFAGGETGIRSADAIPQ
jgi:hypothetical protein